MGFHEMMDVITRPAIVDDERYRRRDDRPNSTREPDNASRERNLRKVS